MDLIEEGFWLNKEIVFESLVKKNYKNLFKKNNMNLNKEK